MTSWRHDLWANAGRRGWKGACIGWFANPGFAVVTLHRASAWGHRRGGRLGRLVAMTAWRAIVGGYGCYFAPSARIGRGLRLPHPIGIVIGEGATIGDDCAVYQHVTFGRRDERDPACSTIGDGVVVYAGASLVGAISVGAGAVVAAHAVVLSDVPARATAAGIPARVRTGSVARIEP